MKIAERSLSGDALRLKILRNSLEGRGQGSAKLQVGLDSANQLTLLQGVRCLSVLLLHALYEFISQEVGEEAQPQS